MREDAASARHAFCRDDVLRLLDALEAAEAELRAIREEVRADPAAKTVDAVAALFASARCSVEDAQREAERLRHGVPIEGDFVCPNDLRATTAERERDAYRAGLIVAIEAMHRWGAEGDGVPEDGFIGEAFDRGRALVKLGPEVRHG